MGVVELVATIAAVIKHLADLAKSLADTFKLDEDKLRAELASKHQITDVEAEKALEIIRKASE